MSILSSNIARNTLALMAAGTTVLLAIMLLSFWLVGETRESARNVELGRDLRIAASTILSDLIDAETGQRGYLLTGRESYLEPYEATKAHLAESVNTLRERAQRTPEIGADVAKVEGLVAQKMKELSGTIEIYRAGRSEEALALVQTDEGKKAMDEVRTILDRIITAMNTRVSDSLERLESSAQKLSWATLFGGLSIAAFSALAFYLMNTYARSRIEARRDV